VTTDHISPAGSFKPDTPAGQYLQERQVAPRDFNSYGARRGNHEVMMRGTFANIRIRNEMVPGVEGGYSKGPEGQKMSIFAAAMAYRDKGIPTIIVAGKEYGTGSSRDWAAKGPALLGVRAVIAESYERIHRSNLVGMGIVPFEFAGGEDRRSLNLRGDETVSIKGLSEGLEPRKTVKALISYADGKKREIDLLCRIDTGIELEYVEHGGVLHYVLRQLLKS
jgi:aconitate hydratase